MTLLTIFPMLNIYFDFKYTLCIYQYFKNIIIQLTFLLPNLILKQNLNTCLGIVFVSDDYNLFKVFSVMLKYFLSVQQKSCIINRIFRTTLYISVFLLFINLIFTVLINQ